MILSFVFTFLLKIRVNLGIVRVKEPLYNQRSSHVNNLSELYHSELG
jgi:hypothetical protein